ncbi:MAG: DUF4359 domain-containing protein [Pseudanabaenaceae cyanobacterium bins.68]|nr:DUF4359 domain-containing protein [Pseudanabaenaceae cyanobacterium bins.68]
MKSIIDNVKIPLIVIGSIAIALVVTNPDQEAFLNHGSQTMAEEIKDNICAESGLGNLVKDICESAVEQQKGSIRVYLNNFTRRQNFIVGSVYTTELPKNNYIAIGALGNFISFKQTK